jgi:hypothetical protein
MSVNTKPTTLKSVEVKPTTVEAAELTNERLHNLALLEITELNKRLAKRKTDKLDPYERALLTYAMSRFRPKPVDEPSAIEVFRQAFVDAGFTVTYGAEKRASTYVRKGEHRPRVRQSTGNGKRTRGEEAVLRSAGILPRIVYPDAPPVVDRMERRRARQRAAAQADNDKSKD